MDERRSWRPMMDEGPMKPAGQTAEDRHKAHLAEIPVHCAACGGEFSGTTELHNGICDACHKLTHGPNYRLVAELNRKSEALEDQREITDNWRRTAVEEHATVESVRSAWEIFKAAMNEALNGW